MVTLRTPDRNMILMIADTTQDSGLLYDYLRGFGFKVLVAEDGESGLAIAENAEPDIILLDVVLPGIDGFETCQRLKHNAVTQHIPVIFITSQTDIVHKVRGFSVGAVDYIAKPIQSEEVLTRVKTHLTLQTLQRRLAEKNARLQTEIAQREKLIEELDAFAHTVAHDLKNPLAVTINYSQFLDSFADQLSDDERKEYAGHIKRNGYKMNNIINELLLLASVRTEDIELEPVEMGYVVEGAIDRLAYMLDEKGAKLVAPEEWPLAMGYGPWIEEVWANYISNAVKYGGEPPHIELGATELPGDLVQFWVKDNGEGLTPEQQNKLFIQFERLNQVKAQGHGLGLSIVQRIMEKLGGQVGVESAGLDGEGSIFSFYLPKFKEPDNIVIEEEALSAEAVK